MRTDHVQNIANMRLTFQKELQQQRLDQDAKVQEIRRQADEVRVFLFFFPPRKNLNFIFRMQNNFSMIELLVFKMKTIVYVKSYKNY
jgi:hypothetical protein